jgi:hypothetical protein
MISVFTKEELMGLEIPHLVTLSDINPPQAIMSKPELESFINSLGAPIPTMPRGRYLHSVDRVSPDDVLTLHTDTSNAVQTTTKLRDDGKHNRSVEYTDEHKRDPARETDRQAIGGPSHDRACSVPANPNYDYSSTRSETKTKLVDTAKEHVIEH